MFRWLSRGPVLPAAAALMAPRGTRPLPTPTGTSSTVPMAVPGTSPASRCSPPACYPGWLHAV